MSAEPVSFLGLDFQPMTTEAAVKAVSALGLLEAPFGYVVTPNVDHMIRLHGDASLRPLYEGAALLVNDSRILELLAGRDGLDFPASPGADIVARLFAAEIKPDDPVVVIGGDAVSVEAVKARFGLQNLHWHSPPMGLKENRQAIAQAAAFMAVHPARFHFLCLGSPQQEMVALAAKARGDVVGIGLCCGASLDFLSGRTVRAPEWMRNARLEWFHRLLSEPRRLIRRYLVDGPKIFAIWRKWRKSLP